MRSSCASGQRGAVGCDDFADTGAIRGDDVHIAFDHDQAVGLSRGGAGAVDVVERAALVEEDRLWRIEIFGLAVAKDASAKGDGPPALVADREHQPAAETIVGLLGRLLGPDEHAGIDELVLTEVDERGFQFVAPIGSKAKAEARHGRSVDPALGEVAPRLAAFHALQRFGKPCLRRRHDVSEIGGALGLVAHARVGGREIETGGGGKFLHCVHERQSARVGEEADRVAMRPAAEAMVETLLVIYGEGGALFAVEGAARFIFSPGLGQLDRRGDHGAERGAGAQFIEELSGQAHWVSLSSEMGERVILPPCQTKPRSS
jgi:hypothetical protein